MGNPIIFIISRFKVELLDLSIDNWGNLCKLSDYQLPFQNTTGDL